MVIQRREGESVVIGPGVRVTLTKVANGRATLGITADRSVRIRRAELEPKEREAKS